MLSNKFSNENGPNRTGSDRFGPLKYSRPPNSIGWTRMALAGFKRVVANERMQLGHVGLE